jgi:tRNA(adenine34) deaminase
VSESKEANRLMAEQVDDEVHFSRAIELALEAEARGNLPIGAVIVLDGEIVAEGRNAIWTPSHRPNRHAELEALRVVPEALWETAAELTLYSTLEPCLMCAGAILLHGIGRAAFGAADPVGGCGMVFANLPPYFERSLAASRWEGPLDTNRCQPLFERSIRLLRERGELEQAGTTDDDAEGPL